jgi:hypothetical protein
MNLQHPATRVMLEVKFRNCVPFAAKPLAGSDVERATALIRDHENVPDVSKIIQLLTPIES